MTIQVKTLAKTEVANIQPTNENPLLECCARIFNEDDSCYSVEYSHKPVHIIGEKGWAIDNLTWAYSLSEAETCVAELFRALEQSYQIETWFG
ncbi:hypothetical protein N9741_00580 [Octadecabacter sp.]|nr:hypothetical protein [Octadecabacter sp.]